MSKINELKAEEVFDSRGNPTVMTVCILESGAKGTASVPSGASTGAHEAHELRDGDPSRYSGKGVLKAVENVNTEIFNFLKDKDFSQNSLDNTLIRLDGTENKSRLGANAILSVSLAFARAKAVEESQELFEYIQKLTGIENKPTLPYGAFNIINGGKHADSGISFQEFMIIPINFPTFSEKVKVAGGIIETLKTNLENDGYSTHLGDEGGFAPKLASNEEALNYLLKAIEASGYSTDDVKLGLDVASSTFYKNGNYEFEGKVLNADEMIQMYEDLITKYPIISIEDPLDEEDFDGFAKLTEKIGEKINIVGDDLIVTNKTRLQKAIDRKSINTVLIKLNQIGTLSETLETIELAQTNNIKTFISHRSGETLDTFIADLAVSTDANFIKSGSLTRPERVAKYSRIIEIEKSLTASNKI